MERIVMSNGAVFSEKLIREEIASHRRFKYCEDAVRNRELQNRAIIGSLMDFLSGSTIVSGSGGGRKVKRS